MSYFLVPSLDHKTPIEIFKLTDLDFAARNLGVNKKFGWYYCPASFDNVGRVQAVDDEMKRAYMYGPFSAHEDASSAAIFDLWCS